jgi:UDP-glucose 4-epimerase
VIHIAALKAVGESFAFPIKYYETNVVGSVNLLSVSLPLKARLHGLSLS